MGHGHHHHHGRRRGFRGGRVFVTSDIMTDDCYLERLADGTMVRRCPELGAGDLFPTFVTPDDARQAISETENGYDRLNIAILASQAAPPEFKASWGIQFAGFKTFAAGARATVGFLNTKAVMDQNDRYQAQLGQWSSSFASVGGSPGPAPLPPGQGTGEQVSLAGLLGGSTGLIVAGAALAAILVFGPHFTKG